jgi:hypothetical protein
VTPAATLAGREGASKAPDHEAGEHGGRPPAPRGATRPAAAALASWLRAGGGSRWTGPARSQGAQGSQPGRLLPWPAHQRDNKLLRLPLAPCWSQLVECRAAQLPSSGWPQGHSCSTISSVRSRDQRHPAPAEPLEICRMVRSHPGQSANSSSRKGSATHQTQRRRNRFSSFRSCSRRSGVPARAAGRASRRRSPGGRRSPRPEAVHPPDEAQYCPGPVRRSSSRLLRHHPITLHREQVGPKSDPRGWTPRWAAAGRSAS